MLKKKAAMKKIYKNPTLKIVQVQPANMICESMTMRGNYNSETVTIGSRRNNDFWDDEEDYE